jgi:hypothetical protein
VVDAVVVVVAGEVMVLRSVVVVVVGWVTVSVSVIAVMVCVDVCVTV